MYKGTMIDELIAAVARAEAHARTAAPVERKPQPVIAQAVYPELVHQTPFIAAVMGAA